MGYNTIFEIGFRSFPWLQLLQPVLFVLLGTALFRFGKRKQINQVVGIIMAAFAAIFVSIAAINLIPKFIEIRHSYKRGNSSIVEGVVENFHAAPELGAAEESFSVRGVNFSYNALGATSCFRNAPFHKGPIRTGIAVRIFYHDGCIQRVDIQR
jgi:hypothetical protein